MRAVPIVLLGALAAHAQERPPAPVVVAPVVEREVTARRTFVGTVEPVRDTVVGAEVDGLVVEYLIDEGDRVAAGQPLARLRSRVVEIRIDAAKAERTLREEELAELENGSRPEEIEQARARVQQAQATVDVRQWKLDRAQELFASNVISEDELKDARLLARVAAETLQEAQAELRLVEAGPRRERIAQAAARVEAQRAELARLQDELDRHTIRAPFDGYVVEEYTEVGAWLGRGDPVAEIAALDQVDIVVPVLEDYAVSLQPGMEVPFTVGALPDRSFVGTLAAVVPKADPRARTFPVKVRYPNPRQGDSVLLKAGMFAVIQLSVGRKETALLVPKDALVLGGGSPIVYVVDEESGIVRPVPVETGIGVDAMIQVRGALQPGWKVVVRGNERLRPGQSVQVTETLD